MEGGKGRKEGVLTFSKSSGEIEICVVEGASLISSMRSETSFFEGTATCEDVLAGLEVMVGYCTRPGAWGGRGNRMRDKRGKAAVNLEGRYSDAEKLGVKTIDL